MLYISMQCTTPFLTPSNLSAFARVCARDLGLRLKLRRKKKMNNNLGFFKVYLPPPKGPERLPIPSAFVKHVKGAIPDKAFLRNCHGKLWPVVVTKVGNQLCFKDGWVKFVEDNSVEVGNFLVFDFDGNYVFDFKLFGRTECEIKMIGSSGFKVKEEKEEEEEEEEKVKEEEEEEEEEEEDELEANTLRKKTEKGKSEKSTKGLKKIKQGTNCLINLDGNKGRVTIKDKGGNKRAYRTEVEDEEGDELEAKTLRKKTEKGKSEKSTKGLKKINQGTNYGNKGKATIKDKGGNKRACRMEVEDEEEETDDDDEEEDELEATTLRKKAEKGKSEKSTKGLKKINQGTCYGNKRKATIKDKGGNKRAYTMEVEEEEEETDDDEEEEEDELEAKALRKKTENGIGEKSTKGLKKINQGTSYGNKGKATIKDKGGNKRAYTMEVEEEEEEETDDDDDEEDELEAKILRKKTEKEKSEKSAKGLEKISQGTSYGNKGKDTIKGEGGNKRADTIAVEDDEDVFKYGMVSWPKNPCFVAKLRSTRRTELYVPMDVIRDHNLKLPSNLILLDEEGRKWSTRVVQWNDGRTWLTVGWKAFCKWNNLKWEDRCICEFIRGKGRRGIFIKTCILRAGSWLPKKDSILSSDHQDQVDKRHFQGSPK
ncbi:cilia- and flagella-associated protein 251-like isoform X4 [Camellia sinensis]|uniref:cilia- and flagella-associated protein 251-like isoform X4 n=1 Tax=Camellia sinensis TaxID=4442 RepID=UPI0010362873|nr:cilia- and flagella-associated protein 251-like isoform X4 [Camellia sinensis]